MTDEKQGLAHRMRMARELSGLSQGQAAKQMHQLIASSPSLISILDDYVFKYLPGYFFTKNNNI